MQLGSIRIATALALLLGGLKMQDRKMKDQRGTRVENEGPNLRGRKIHDRKMHDRKMQDWKMQDWKMQDQKCRGGKCRTEKYGTNFTWWFQLKKKTQNALCIVVLHLYYLMQERIVYFVTAVVTSAFNWHIINWSVAYIVLASVAI